MRVALFFDGKNFYSGWRDTAQGKRIDFVKLADWLVKRVGGTHLWGAHYYTGVEAPNPAEPPQKLAGFLDVLETQPGFFVYRFPRKQHKVTCTKCGAENKFTYEKEVDTTMVADMLRYAAVSAFDVAVLMSGDADYAPAVEGVRALGKQAYVASWAGAGVSQRIRRAAFDHVDLMQGLAVFERTDAAPEEAPPVILSADDHQRAKEAFVAELKIAEEKFDGGYVGLGYFVARWRSAALDPSADVRRRVLEELVHDGKVEVYEAPDRAQAIRVVRDRPASTTTA